MDCPNCTSPLPSTQVPQITTAREVKATWQQIEACPACAKAMKAALCQGRRT